MSNKNGVGCFMADLYIICGHGHGDSGAVGHGYTEAERVRALGKRIAELGGSHVHLLDTSRNWYADNGVSSLSIPKGACLVELHMDSGASSARGAHVIIKAGIGGADKYDNALANKLAAIFPGRASKIVERSDLANPNRAYRRGINYRLAENGFISNAGDVNTFNSRMDDIARAYLEAFEISAQATTSANRSVSVQLYDGNATDAQRWTVTHDSNGYITLTSKSCGLALDVVGAGTASGTAVRVYTPNGTDAQKWKIIQKAGEYNPDFTRPMAFAPKVNENLRLDCVGGGKTNGTGIQVYTANNTSAQEWQVLDHGDGTWTLINVGSSQALDVVGGGR